MELFDDIGRSNYALQSSKLNNEKMCLVKTTAHLLFYSFVYVQIKTQEKI